MKQLIRRFIAVLFHVGYIPPMKHSIDVCIASWFYTGFIPPIYFKKMSGTWGSLFSLPLCWALIYYGGESTFIHICLAIWIIFWIGIIVVKKAEEDIGKRIDWQGEIKTHDQNEIVIDETFGILITCLPLTFIPVQHLNLALFTAFFLFRIFDIIKIPPTKVFDRMKNSWGVMLDDAMAGLYAALLLYFILKYTAL